MSISKQEKYNALKLLIKERQEKENKQALQEHLDHSTTINYQDIDGNSLLHYAAALGRLKDVEALLDHHVLLEIDLTNDDYALFSISIMLPPILCRFCRY